MATYRNINLALVFLAMAGFAPLSFGAKPIQGSARILRCLPSNPGMCEVLVGKSFLNFIGPKSHFSLSYQGKELYEVRSYRRVETRRGAYLLTTTGSWYISSRESQALLRGKPLLTAVGFDEPEENAAFTSVGYGAAYTNRAAPSERREEEPRKEKEAETKTAENTKSHNKNSEGAEPSQGEAFEKFKQWAKGDPDEEGPVASIVLKVGTPASPSAATGASLEFYPTSITPLIISGGEFNSTTVVNQKYGRMRQQSISVGTGLLMGRGLSKLFLGAHLSSVHYKMRAAYDEILQGQGATADSSNKGKFKDAAAPEPLVREDGTFDTIGVTPTLGFRLMSSGFSMLSLEVGRFYPLSDSARYDEQIAAPLAKRAKDNFQASQGRTSINLGLGIGF